MRSSRIRHSACLGPRVVDSFGARLPFMMKLLAAAEPLSLQVHPSSERARIRFAQQTVEGVALTARERSYQDESHKPELIFALTRFEGMAGFRDVKKSAAILRLLGGQWLDEIADELEQSNTPFQSLRRVVTEMLALSGSDLAEKLESVRQLAAQAKSRLHRPPSRRRPTVVDRASVERESVRVFDQTLSLIDRYPKDPGVLVTLLLNHVVLAPGEAMYIPAGVIHAYTAGFGVEVMASSDNVVARRTHIKARRHPRIASGCGLHTYPAAFVAGNEIAPVSTVFNCPRLCRSFSW